MELWRTLDQEALFGGEGASQKVEGVVRLPGFAKQSAGSTGRSDRLNTKTSAEWLGPVAKRLNHTVSRDERSPRFPEIGKGQKALSPASHSPWGYLGGSLRWASWGARKVCWLETGLAAPRLGNCCRLCACLLSFGHRQW